MAEPTKKSQKIEDFLKAKFGVNRGDSIRAEICVGCGKPVTGFKDELSKKEYTISGFCQSCQDEIFG